MDVEDKLRLITTGLEEVITESRLRFMLEEGRRLRGYIGVEPSGLFSIGWLIWAEKFKELVDVGVDMVLLEATWHAWINDKLGGDLGNIRICAEYIEHCLRAIGVDIGRVELVKADSMVGYPDYWALVLKVAKNLSLARVKRAITIMGRRSSEARMDFSKLIYPCMQVADIFYLNLDLCLGGMDQRRAHVLAIEIAEKLGYRKPVALHTPLLIGLSGIGRMDVTSISEEDWISVKMSKSKPETCIFIHDDEDTIRSKIRKAYCPPKDVRGNPITEICRLLLFRRDGYRLRVERRNAMYLEIESYGELESLYVKGEIHPLDLKEAVAEALAEKLKPIRDYFNRNSSAYKLLKVLENMTVTR
ncbi:MAG: tyrosine--tRNA ligase [Candidatus Bathyarchaeota archaeon]|nr:tyrosine--tRNA ligase [Candidatus Bathyarchaeota archaeon]